MRTKKILAFVMMAAAMLASAPISASAKPSINLGSGVTRVSLSGDFAAAIQALHLRVGNVGESSLYGTVANFPIVTGVVDLQNAKGEINHSGGLYLATQSTRVELTGFSIDTSATTPVLTGLVTVNEDFVGRIPLFRLELPALSLPLETQGFGLVYIPGVKLTLAPEAAQALNSVFNVSAFAGGFNIGTAQVFALSVKSRFRFSFGRDGRPLVLDDNDPVGK